MFEKLRNTNFARLSRHKIEKINILEILKIKDVDAKMYVTRKEIIELIVLSKEETKNL